MRLMRELSSAPVAKTALFTALDLLGQPAFIVDASGAVAHANRLGEELLIATHDRMRSELRAAVRNASPAWQVVGCPDTDAFVLIRRTAPLPPDGLSADAAVRWNLTPRESQVLRTAAEGLTNRSIANALGCSERTVEVHVTRLFTKMRCGTRTELVAAFWKALLGLSPARAASS